MRTFPEFISPTLGEQRKCRRLRPGDPTTSEASAESAVQSAPHLGHHPARYETVAQVVLYIVTCTEALDQCQLQIRRAFVKQGAEPWLRVCVVSKR